MIFDNCHSLSVSSSFWCSYHSSDQDAKKLSNVSSFHPQRNMPTGTGINCSQSLGAMMKIVVTVSFCCVTNHLKTQWL